MGKFEDLTGQRFGRLVVIEKAEDHISPSGYKFSQWLCLCDCGGEKTILASSLKRGNTCSCGCLHKEAWHSVIAKHEKCDSRLYRIWKGIKVRCNNKNSRAYKNYGLRGVAICNQWKEDFQAFYDWSMANGYSDELSIDRIDTNGDYSPENCRWVTGRVQANNKRSSHYLTYNGKTMTMAEWARESGVPYRRLKDRICKLGWSVEDALK
jgi:hypothetical protein